MWWLMLCSWVWAQSSTTCNRLRYLNNIKTEIKFSGRKPRITYKRVQRAKMIRKSGKRGTVGLTIAGLESSINFKTMELRHKNTTCIFVTEVRFVFGYDKQEVLIDKRYAPGTCEYQVIMRHENLHVQFNNSGAERFKPRFKQVIRQEFHRVAPLELSNRRPKAQQIQQWLYSLREIPYLDQLRKDVRKLQDLHHNRIDSDHNYKRENKLCKNW